jgi:hypothetical protein
MVNPKFLKQGGVDSSVCSALFFARCGRWAQSEGEAIVVRTLGS